MAETEEVDTLSTFSSRKLTIWQLPVVEVDMLVSWGGPAEVHEGSCRERLPFWGFRVLGFGFQVSGFGFRVSSFGFRVPGFGFRVSDFEFQVSGFEFRAPGIGEAWRESARPRKRCSRAAPRPATRRPWNWKIRCRANMEHMRQSRPDWEGGWEGRRGEERRGEERRGEEDKPH